MPPESRENRGWFLSRACERLEGVVSVMVPHQVSVWDLPAWADVRGAPILWGTESVAPAFPRIVGSDVCEEAGFQCWNPGC